MRHQHLLIVIFSVAISMFAASCSAFRTSTANVSGSAEPAAAASVQPEAGGGKAQLDQQIRKVDFKNFTYEPECAYDDNKKITVKNGDYSYEKPQDGYTDRFDFNVFEISYGDLNADNSEEAIVLTTCNTGGTGNFTQGFIYTLKDGKPALFGTIPGGDRAEGGLRTARVENGQLVVESNDPGETGGACCPEFILTKRYDASTGKLKQVGKVDRRPVFQTERVNFAKGATSTTIKVHLPSQEGKRFILGARSGQVLEATTNNEKAEVRLLEDAESSEITNGFSAVLAKSGDFTIELTNYADTPLDVVLTIRIH
jgi:hypothetical protein